MADNTDHKPLDNNPANTSSGKLPGEIIPAIEAEAINQHQETENMEVHKHPQHVMHKKKWEEYLLEFFMLFFAVFLGFVAENIRENINNREIEKNNIRSFVNNLREDSVALVRSIDVNEKRFVYLDSVIKLKTRNVSKDVFQHEFVYYMLKLGYLNYFSSNESTYEQMKSSGTLRLISHKNVLDSILNYETQYHRVVLQQDLCSKWWNKSIEEVSSVIDLTTLTNLPLGNLWTIKEKDLDGVSLPAITQNLPALRLYYNWRVNERIALGYYIQNLYRQVSHVRMLIPFLSKIYHLENE